MGVEIGDIFWLECEYDDIDFSEERPVVVIDLDEDRNTVVAVVTEITSQPPKDLESGYGQYRAPLFNWREIGLEKASYAKANKIARVDADALKKRIGHMDSRDVEAIRKYVRKYLADKAKGLVK